MGVVFPVDESSLAPLCEQLDAWRERLDLKGPLPRRWTGRLRRDLEAESVAGSLGIERIPVTVDEVRRILAGATTPTVTQHDRELVEGYVEAMGFVLRRADDPAFTWSGELIRGLQDRILAGDHQAGAGRFASSDRWLADARTGERRFEPAAPRDIPQLVNEVCEQANESASHPAILGAWIHVAVAAIHPFRDGNGRTARVLASLAMHRGGFQRREFTSLEEWWGARVEDYYRAFECLGPRFNDAADVTPFVDAHLRAQLAQVMALDLRERVERRIWTAIDNVVTDRTLHPRLAHAVWEVFWGREVTSGYFVGMTDVSTATATKDLAAATASGLLAATGERRGRRYHAGDWLLPSLRREFGFDDLPEDLAGARGRIGQLVAAAIADAPAD